MKEKKNDIIAKYQYEDYFIYIKETEDCYEYYLQHKDYCIMYMMYGVEKDKNTIEDLLAIAKNIILDDIDIYKERFED